MSGIEDASEILWYATLISFGNLLVSITSYFIVDRIRRRKLLIFSLCASAVGLLVIACTFIVVYLDSPRVSRTTDLPALGFNSLCGSYDRCFTCVEDRRCGFCFETTTKRNSRAFCLPINPENTYGKYRPENCPSTSKTDTNTKAFQWKHMNCPGTSTLPLVSGLIFFLSAFAIGVGPLPWIINAELYPLWARNVCQSAATSTNWVFNLLISLSFLNMIEIFSTAGVFIFFSVLTFCGSVFFYFLLPETKYVKLEDVGSLFDGGLLVPFKVGMLPNKKLNYYIN